jgi:uncharacterized protein YidB (DUF937 family)
MNILDDIIQTAVGSQHSVPVLLRKCLLLAHELKNEPLKDWANHELNGYSPSDRLPEYRKLNVDSKGNFVGPMGASLQSYPIPTVSLKPQHREFAEELKLLQPISAYEGAIGDGDGVMSYEWPSNLCVAYQRKIYQGYALVAAWQSVSKSTLIAMLDTIRNRALNMALEIKNEIGDKSNLRELPASAAGKIRETITQTIFNGPAYFSSDNAQVNVVSNSSQAIITAGNREELDKALLEHGLDHTAIERLSEALSSDGGTLGSKVNSWIKRNAPKLAASGAQVGMSVGQTLLTSWLKSYCGLS